MTPEDLPLALFDHPPAFTLGEFSEGGPDEGGASSASARSGSQFVKELQDCVVNSYRNSFHIGIIFEQNIAR